MLKISQRKSMNHCRFRALDTKGQSDNAVCYSSLTYYRYPVEPQEDTSFFVEQLSLDSLEMDNQFADKSANVTYHAEAVQKNIGVEAIASAWNKKATINQNGEIIKLEEQ